MQHSNVMTAREGWFGNRSLVKIGVAVTLGALVGLTLPSCTSADTHFDSRVCPTYYAYTPAEEKSILTELRLYAPEIPYTTHAVADYGRVRAQIRECKEAR